MRYNVGEQVVIVNERCNTSLLFWNPDMDIWCGKTLTISKVYDGEYSVEENHWSWNDDFIDHEATAALHNPPESEFIDPYTIDYYTDKAMNALNNFDDDGILMSDDIRHTRIGIRKNVSAWYNNKKSLFNVLRKHPLWNEEAKAVIYLNTEHRLPNADDAQNAFNELIRMCFDSDIRELIESEHSEMTDEEFIEMIHKTSLRKHGYYSDGKSPVEVFQALFKKMFRSETMNVITPNIADTVNTLYPDIKAVVGQKTSRVANKIFCKFGFDKSADYNRCFAKLADAMNPFNVERISVLSVNFMDYLLMSNGNSWSSCHTIINNRGNNYNGCYKGGTLSYANDSTSLIFYTLDKNYQGTDYCLEPKISRQVFFWDYPVLVQERLYPQSNDDTEAGKTLVKQYRQIVESIFAEALGKPNLWVKENRNHAEIKAGDDTFMYHDWESFPTNYVHLKQEISVSENEVEDENDSETVVCNRSYVIRSAKNITVGSESYCTCCGGIRYEGNFYDSEDECKTTLCSDCCSGIECYECGRRYERDDMHYIDGEYYCDDCCFYCEYHNEYEIGNYEYVRDYGNVCEYALDNSGDFSYCDDCGEYYSSGEAYCVHDRYGCEIWVCGNCLDDYERCEECGEYFYSTEEIDGRYYCKDCADKIREEMEVEEKDDEEDVA